MLGSKSLLLTLRKPLLILWQQFARWEL
jgi:hypothetical protein